MLKEIQVKNFAIIDDIKLRFGKGLNILTGETGAGKTLIIEAINLLIGERADSSLIRDDEEKLFVQGFFDFSNNNPARSFLLSGKFIEKDDNAADVVITREVNRLGKNRSFINGIFTQVGFLKQLGYYTIDLHGQHEHQYLLDPKTHIDIVDEYGKHHIRDARHEFTGLYQKYMENKKKYNDLAGLQTFRDEKLNDLNFRYNEIKKLNLREDEETGLENELRILKNSEKIFRLADEAAGLIKGDNEGKLPLSERISVLEDNIRQLSGFDHNFRSFSERIKGFSEVIDELSHFLSSYIDEFDFSTGRLDRVQERLFKITELKNKYGMELDGIIKYAGILKEEIDGFEGLEKEIEKAAINLRDSAIQALKSGVKLSSQRAIAIKELDKKITEELKDLGFNSVTFRTENRIMEDSEGLEYDGKKIKLTVNGFDEIEFFISLNTGESPRPLGKIASGGEISRIMLALKSAIYKADNISTLIFDEIDSGIGGTTSFIVGEKLFSVSRQSQVIAITHLAQIAGFADNHFFIDKIVDKKRTKIRIKKLVEVERPGEIGRMLGSLNGSNISIMHARELLEKCISIKNSLMKEEIKVGN
ncbi:MAG: DNA repair protein RecN [Actinobacteria bacterium]|nr:DNA repair protein RecN [Actinomycetota bacterium]